MEEGAQVPVIEIGALDGKGYVIDGWHRVMAASRNGAVTIGAAVRHFRTMDQLIEAASMANSTQGLHRTNADKRRSVYLYLKTERGKQASTRDVAKACGVSHTFVRQMIEQEKGPKLTDDFPAPPVNADRQRIAAPRDGILHDEHEGPEIPPEHDRLKEAKEVFVAVESHIKYAIQILESVSSDEKAAWLNIPTTLGALNNARRAVASAAPGKVCGKCFGEGCDECRLAGWLPARAL